MLETVGRFDRSNGFVFLALIFIAGTYADEDCDSNSSFTMADAVEISNHMKIWNLAQKSLSNFIPCQSKNCSCYFATLTKDLEPFKRGINRGLLEAAKSSGTTYLVYKNKLYRSKECPFPAR